MSDRLSDELRYLENELKELRVKQNLRNMNLLDILCFKRPNIIDFSNYNINDIPEVSVRNYSSTVKIVYKNNDSEEHVFVSDFLQGEDLRTLYFKGKLQDNSFKELRISREVVSNIEVITKEI